MGPNLNNLYGVNSVLDGGGSGGMRRIGSSGDYCYTSSWLQSNATKSWNDKLMNKWLQEHSSPKLHLRGQKERNNMMAYLKRL